MGKISKIIEEFEELMDAHKQGIKILEICELCDLLGAIEAYANSKLEVSFDDLIAMMNKTKSAFKSGDRK